MCRPEYLLIFWGWHNFKKKKKLNPLWFYLFFTLRICKKKNKKNKWILILLLSFLIIPSEYHWDVVLSLIFDLPKSLQNFIGRTLQIYNRCVLFQHFSTFSWLPKTPDLGLIDYLWCKEIQAHFTKVELAESEGSAECFGSWQTTTKSYDNSFLQKVFKNLSCFKS